MNFVLRRLPWIVALGALALYLPTLGQHITHTGLAVVAKLLGWDWQPSYFAPVLGVLTYPVRWLPPSWQLVALNLFSTACSVLTLALLARSVAILPQDRTQEQRAFERSEYSFLSIRSAWVPPLLAVLVCGLQLSFWENAVLATGESLDLLMFAYCVRCLLEYRVAGKESWLGRLAVVYGLSLTNNYAMIAFLPLFLIALVWSMGRNFFRPRFLLRLAGLGLAGMSWYFVLPAVNSLTGMSDLGFWEIVRTHLSFQRNTLWNFPRFLLVIISFTSLLPILFIGIRWPAQYGDVSAAGNALANLMMHVVHGLLLGVCLWVAFDPTFSPRALGQRYGQPWAFLPFYYLSSLTVGYCAGYFLLVFGTSPVKPWRRPTLLERILKKTIWCAVWVLLAGVPAGLLLKNLPDVRAAQAPHLSHFGTAAAEGLPASGAVVLSDDAYRLYAVESALRHTGRHDRYVMVNTSFLDTLAYQRFLQRKYPQRWPDLPREPLPQVKRLGAPMLIQMLRDVRLREPVYYLHPSFGYYFEFFHLQPHNLLYTLEFSPTNQIANPLPSPEQFQTNDQFWREFRPLLNPLLADLQRKGGDKQRMIGFPAVLTGSYYSRSLNYLGTEYQRAGEYRKAGDYFAAALEFNDRNPSAYINQVYNRQLQEGQRASILPNAEAEELLANYRGNIELVLNLNGPIEEPQICYLMSQVLAKGRNFRQAIQQLQRAAALNPVFYEARVALATLYARLNQADQGLQEIAAMRVLPGLAGVLATNPLPLIQAEALAYAVKRDFDKSFALLRQAQAQYPAQPVPFTTEVQIHLARNDLTNALRVLDRQIANQTNNPSALIDYGVVKLQTKAAHEAIPYFTRALAVAPDNTIALMNRALAYLETGALDAALKDYQRLLVLLPKPTYRVHYGLGEIFYRKKNAATALKHYEDYLKLAPPGLAEVKTIQERVKKLRSGAL